MSGASGFEQVQRSMWDDPPFAVLSPEGKVLYLWTYTAPSVSGSGIFRAQEGLILLHTGLKQARLAAAWEEVASHRMAFYYDGYVWCRARVKNLRGVNPRWALSIVREIERLSVTHALRRAFVEEYRDSEELAKATTRRDGEPVNLWHEVVEATDDAMGIETHSDGSGDPSETHQTPSDDGKSPMGHATHSRPMAMGHLHLISSSPTSRASRTTRSTRSVVGRARDSRDVESVWEHFLGCLRREGRAEHHLPRLDGARDLIVRALGVASVEEIQLAIDGLFADPWYRENDRLRIRYAIHGRKDRDETDRERIDDMIARARRGAPRPPGQPTFSRKSPLDTFEIPTEQGA